MPQKGNALTEKTPVIIFGSLPPPIGGVSVFISRHAAELEKKGRNVSVFNWTTSTIVDRLKNAFRSIAHPSRLEFEVHGFQTLPLLIVILRPFSSISTFWMHSGQFSGRLNGWRRMVLQAAINRFSQVVLVSPHIIEHLENNGFTLRDNFAIQHAFLKPDLTGRTMLWDKYPPETQSFASRPGPLLVMQGSDAFHMGVDRYGSDVAIEALSLIRSSYPDAHLLIGRPSVGSKEFELYCETLNDRERDLGLSNSVHVLQGEQELWPLTSRADVFLRPSNEDGDSISVREALSLDVPVVASDCCPRPAGCHIHRNRDAADLARVVCQILSARKHPPAPLSSVSSEAGNGKQS